MQKAKPMSGGWVHVHKSDGPFGEGQLGAGVGGGTVLATNVLRHACFSSCNALEQGSGADGIASMLSPKYMVRQQAATGLERTEHPMLHDLEAIGTGVPKQMLSLDRSMEALE